MRKREQVNLVQAGRWTAYAAAGTAAALGAGGAAEADIFYSGVVNIGLTDTTPTNGDFEFVGLGTLQGGTNLIFTPAHAFVTGAQSGIAAIFRGTLGTQQFGPGSAVGFSNNGFNYVSKLAYGQNISTLGFLGAGYRQTMAWFSGYTNSQFLQPGEGYVGFRFDVGNGTQYGWMKVNMDGQPLNTWTIVEYAYASPGQAIFAGQTAAIPEAGSMGLLALGGVGLMMWRKRREQNSAA